MTPEEYKARYWTKQVALAAHDTFSSLVYLSDKARTINDDNNR